MLSCFSLWSGSKERWKVLLLGDNEVGKTSFAYRFSDDVYEESFGKLIFSGDHVKECHFSESDSCEVSLTDTWVSQISYTGTEDEIPFNHGIILMYSITSRWSFQDIARTCRQIPLDPEQDPDLVLILIGTKLDEKASREVAQEEGTALAQELGCHAFYETSAKTGQNVDAAVFAMVQALRRSAADRKVDFMAPIKTIRRWFRGRGI